MTFKLTGPCQQTALLITSGSERCSQEFGPRSLTAAARGWRHTVRCDAAVLLSQDRLGCREGEGVRPAALAQHAAGAVQNAYGSQGFARCPRLSPNLEKQCVRKS